MFAPNFFRVLLTVALSLGPAVVATAAPAPSRAEALAAMQRATRFMVDRVAVRGGYVWSYLPDLSRRWGEMEARPQMIWVQSPGTVQMGHVFLNAYHATGDEAYYEAAAQVAGALIAGQLPCGGWHYLIDFAGEADLRAWYATVGRNAWRLEEYQHYYGNATFDDSATAEATRYLLRFHLEKHDLKAKAALDRAIQFVLDAQGPSGGWPQRFPPAGEFRHGGRPDYTGHITFNDNVTAGNVELLVQCYQALRDPRLPTAIRRGMDVFLATQGTGSQPAWSLQHTPDLKPAGARSYEPVAYATHGSAANLRALLRFYRLTGDRKYLARMPEALAWLEQVKLSPEIQAATGRSHPTFVEIGTNRPLFIHRTGSNVFNGRYYADHDWQRTTRHYASFREIGLAELQAEYATTAALPPSTASAGSPLLHPDQGLVFPRTLHQRDELRGAADIAENVREVIDALDGEGRWIVDLRMDSHPYTKDGTPEPVAGDYSRTWVGDETDTSPFASPVPIPGISTATFVRRMNVLIEYVGR